MSRVTRRDNARIHQRSILVIFTSYRDNASRTTHTRVHARVYDADMQHAGQLSRHIILCKGRACDIIRERVRAQVENTRGTNYPFLHEIIVGERDKAIRVRAVYKSFATIACTNQSRIRECRHGTDATLRRYRESKIGGLRRVLNRVLNRNPSNRSSISSVARRSET